MGKSLEDFKVGDKVKVIKHFGGSGLKDATGFAGVVDGVAPALEYPISVTLDFSELEYETGERVSVGEYAEYFLPGELEIMSVTIERKDGK